MLAIVLLLTTATVAHEVDVSHRFVTRHAPRLVTEEITEVVEVYSVPGARRDKALHARKSQHSAHKHSKHPAGRSSHNGYHGKGTYFKPNHGACGNYNDSKDYIVALSADVYDDGRHCQRSVHVCHKSRCVDAKVTDLCPGCDHTSLDMSPAVFNALANPEEGVIGVDWSFQ